MSTPTAPKDLIKTALDLMGKPVRLTLCLAEDVLLDRTGTVQAVRPGPGRDWSLVVGDYADEVGIVTTRTVILGSELADITKGDNVS